MNHEVANTILAQIRILDRFALGAWGAQKYVAGEYEVGFAIKTPKYKMNHRVRVVLDVGADLYNIEVHNVGMKRIQSGKPTLIAKTKGVYAEDLVNVIDSMIENKG